ncbi:MAG: heat-inducible transcriptional repressor HrcA [Bacillota bacterium]
MRLEGRKKKVLLAIVSDYVSTAEPVGSRTIARKYNLGVSPATIRNEMADLEELGLIEQPHTSAGRIPSDQGYRYYVDWLMEKHLLSSYEKDFIRGRLPGNLREIGELVQNTSQLLAHLTSYASLVMGPRLGWTVFRHCQLVPLDNDRLLVVVINEPNVVEHRIVECPEGISQEELDKLRDILNSKLRGLSVGNIKRDTLQEIYTEMSGNKQLSHLLNEILEKTLQDVQEERVYLGGTLNMLNQPEFKDVNKIKSLLTLLEEGNSLREMLQETAPSGVAIRIGGENRRADIRDCSMVTATYHVDGQAVGTVGILGPTRMEYSKVVSLIEFLSERMSEVLTKMYR